MDSVISTVVATTTAAVAHVFTTNMPLLWVFLIGVGALLAIVGAIIRIFYSGDVSNHVTSAAHGKSWNDKMGRSLK